MACSDSIISPCWANILHNLFQPSLLKPQLFSLNLKISHSLPDQSVQNHPPHTSCSPEVYPISTSRAAIAFPLCFIVSYKQAITNFPSYSPHQKSGLELLEWTFARWEEIHYRNFYFTFFLSNQILSVTQFFYIRRHRRRHRIVPHYLCCLMLIQTRRICGRKTTNRRETFRGKCEFSAATWRRVHRRRDVRSGGR